MTERTPVPEMDDSLRRSGLDVRIGASYWILATIAIALVAAAVFGIPRLTWAVFRHDEYHAPASMGGVFAALVPSVIVFTVVIRANWVKRFDATGVRLVSGKSFPWSELREVRAMHDRWGIRCYEIRFRTGVCMVPWRARIVANRAEVEAALASLQRGANPFVGA